MNVHTDPSLLDVAGATEVLPEFGLDEPSGAEAAAVADAPTRTSPTGTLAASQSCPRKLQSLWGRNAAPWAQVRVRPESPTSTGFSQ